MNERSSTREWQGEERRQGQVIVLTDEQIDHIAEKAAERALEKVYATVGKSVVTRLLWVVGVVALGLVMWLVGKGTITLG